MSLICGRPAQGSLLALEDQCECEAWSGRWCDRGVGARAPQHLSPLIFFRSWRVAHFPIHPIPYSLRASYTLPAFPSPPIAITIPSVLCMCLFVIKSRLGGETCVSLVVMYRPTPQVESSTKVCKNVEMRMLKFRFGSWYPQAPPETNYNLQPKMRIMGWWRREWLSYEGTICATLLSPSTARGTTSISSANCAPESSLCISVTFYKVN